MSHVSTRFTRNSISLLLVGSFMGFGVLASSSGDGGLETWLAPAVVDTAGLDADALYAKGLSVIHDGGVSRADLCTALGYFEACGENDARALGASGHIYLGAYSLPCDTPSDIFPELERGKECLLKAWKAWGREVAAHFEVDSTGGEKSWDVMRKKIPTLLDFSQVWVRYDLTMDDFLTAAWEMEPTASGIFRLIEETIEADFYVPELNLLVEYPRIKTGLWLLAPLCIMNSIVRRAAQRGGSHVAIVDAAHRVVDIMTEAQRNAGLVLVAA
ncbi:MAG: hypothetical protein QG604_462 [Candidatus Dependentiae bacterium]|nr:hypothetical protein [Candidatus Dependentiae bacterium]